MKLEPALEKSGLTVDSEPNLHLAIGRVSTQGYSVVVVGYPMDQRVGKRLLDTLRDPDGPCQRSGLLLLAEPGQIGAASSLVGSGVNKVLSVVEEPNVIALVVKRLTGTRHPLAERLPTDIAIWIDVGGEQRELRAANVSAAGLLVRDDTPPTVGTRFTYSLKTSFGSIRGEAKVVRHTQADREPVSGFGARFCSFERDGRQILASLLRSLKSSREA